ncbi:unnamed protein product [Symbiodinium sp. KB8]|nr:unnamed protein product [Symbiodinium sp. KB8]
MSVTAVGSPTEIIPDDDDEDLASVPGAEVKEEEGEAADLAGEEGVREPGTGANEGDLHTEAAPAMLVDATGGSPGRSKRARERSAPSRSSEPSEPPITSSEMRSLLQAHLATITSSLQGLEGRLTSVENANRSAEGRFSSFENDLNTTKHETKLLHSRVMGVEKKEAANEGKLKQIAKDIAELKAKQTTLPSGALPKASAGEGVPSDPWAAYRAQHGPIGGGAPRAPDVRGDGSGREELSEEDRRTLVFGGWNQDTKKQIILDESGAFLKQDDVKDFVDAHELQVWGPRKSFGMLRFKVREGEEQRGVRDRMWKTIQALRANAHHLASTGAADGGKPMWAQFVKTREARKRSSHGSLIRRVCLAMVADCRHNQEAHSMFAGEESSYEVDWGSGTVWCSEWKLGSSVHRQPRGEHIRLLSSGWIDLEAISRATGVAFDIALHAFERQPLVKVDLVGARMDFLAVQEAPRGECGWSEEQTDGFTWLLHQASEQWRGVGIGIFVDLYDCFTDRIACGRGAAWVVRLKNAKRFVLGSLHCPTGVTVAVYYQAVQEFRKMLQSWHADLPCFVGVDVNESVIWSCEEEENDGRVGIRGGGKIDKFLEVVSCLHLTPVARIWDDRWKATHYPRDVSREGRHIDCVLVRGATCTPVCVDADVRMHINTDHAMLCTDVDIQRTRGGKWRDSRARWVTDPEALWQPQCWDDVKQMARSCTKPRTKPKFVDDEETKDIIAEAKAAVGGDKARLWRNVHQMRRQKRRKWKQDRVGRVAAGDWGAYRDIKAERGRRNWWGGLLTHKSAQKVGKEVTEHLEAKVRVPDLQWDDKLRNIVGEIDCKDNDLRPVHIDEIVQALVGMKSRSSLGPDLIGVDLLRKLCEVAPDEPCHLYTEVLRSGVIPDDWGASFLALLPKVRSPASPGDLRPIAMSSAAFKVMSRVVMNRSFHQLRQPSPWSTSGRGRSCADLVGCIGRVRDMTRDWRLGMVITKLDITGAFDCLDRLAVAQYVRRHMRGCSMPHEERFLLQLLAENDIYGSAPGGATVAVRANRGIRQGSPESAELFGMIVSEVITDLKMSGAWKSMGGELGDMPADVGSYQDDIVLWGDNCSIMSKNISLLARRLREIGLHLAKNKTKVIASKYYKGTRSLIVDGEKVQIQPPGTALRIVGVGFDLDAPPGQQAKELMGRVWSSFHENKHVLCGPGTASTSWTLESPTGGG